MGNSIDYYYSIKLSITFSRLGIGFRDMKLIKEQNRYMSAANLMWRNGDE